MAISKTQTAYIKSLHQKKYRQMYGKFLVEGDKSVRELLDSSFKTDAIYALPEWIEKNHRPSLTFHAISDDELSRLSTHDSPNMVIAVACIPEPESALTLPSALHIACDGLNDPGNAGTIIRIADWFGIPTVIFSENSVDVYNPKVVSAAKGSLFRVKVVYADLTAVFKNNSAIPVLGSYMDGESIYSSQLPDTGILLVGNEANGISETLSSYVKKKIAIPSFGHAESLNAGVATGIIISEWKRRKI
jgi:TrmH family RNA methyltransferase